MANVFSDLAYSGRNAQCTYILSEVELSRLASGSRHFTSRVIKTVSRLLDWQRFSRLSQSVARWYTKPVNQTLSDWLRGLHTSQQSQFFFVKKFIQSAIRPGMAKYSRRDYIWHGLCSSPGYAPARPKEINI